MIVLHLIIIFLSIIIFLCFKKTFRFNKSKKGFKNKRIKTFNKSNLNKWMNLTKKERYNQSIKDSVSYLKNRKVLLDEIRKEYKRMKKSDFKISKKSFK